MIGGLSAVVICDKTSLPYLTTPRLVVKNDNERSHMERDRFFRRATLEICSDVNIEVAMSSFIREISPSVPVDHMFLQIYEPDLGAMRTIATATAEGGEEVDVLTPMPDSVRALIVSNLHRFREGVVAIHTPEENPVAGEMLRFHGIEGSSILEMSLSIQDRSICSVVLTSAGEGRYDEVHIELLSLLKQPFTIALFNTLKHREVRILRDRLDDDNRFLRRELNRISGEEIVGADFGLSDTMALVRDVAATDSPVLITGETGVGKDVIASAIHQSSARRNGPFVAVNCGAIPETLIDSELFGHEKGAFTGAITMKRGRFERADGGTILLDEIGEMPLSAQVRLLRVLQGREIERVGGARTIPVDVRVIAATNRDLEQMILDKSFREDLWFRLNVFPIDVPPLRKRTIDIPALAQHFIMKKSRELKLSHTPTLAPGAIDDLVAYRYPGNVRELENIIERAMIVTRDGLLRFDLDEGSRRRTESSSVVETDTESPFASLDEVIKRHIERALTRTNGKIHGSGGAGELLGVNPNTLRHRMRKLGIPFGSTSGSV